MVCSVRKDPRVPMQDLTNSLSTSVCVKTVRNELQSLGFHSRIVDKKPYLSQKHREKRLDFARRHQNWTVEQWRKIIWCDESTFEIGRNSRRVRVIRKAGEKYQPEHLAPTFKS